MMASDEMRNDESGVATEVASEDARTNLSDLLARTAYGNERFVITRHGKPMAALVPISALEPKESAA